MKINEVVTEAGFWKGVRQGLAPQTVANLDAQQGFRGQVGQGLAFEYEGNLYRLQGDTWLIQDPVNKEFVPAPQAMQDKLNSIVNSSASTSPIVPPSTDKIQPVPKSGAPTSAEQAKLQQKIQAAMAAQKK